MHDLKSLLAGKQKVFWKTAENVSNSSSPKAVLIAERERVGNIEKTFPVKILAHRMWRARAHGGKGQTSLSHAQKSYSALFLLLKIYHLRMIFHYFTKMFTCITSPTHFVVFWKLTFWQDNRVLWSIISSLKPSSSRLAYDMSFKEVYLMKLLGASILELNSHWCVIKSIQRWE